MNVKQLTLAIVIVAATAAVALAPYLSTTINALAKKTRTVGNSNNPCNEHNRSTPAAHCRNAVGKEVNCHGT